VNKLAYLNRTIKVALTHNAASPPTMGRFGNFFPKTDLGRRTGLPKKEIAWQPPFSGLLVLMCLFRWSCPTMRATGGWWSLEEGARLSCFGRGGGGEAIVVVE